MISTELQSSGLEQVRESLEQLRKCWFSTVSGFADDGAERGVEAIRIQHGEGRMYAPSLESDETG